MFRWSVVKRLALYAKIFKFFKIQILRIEKKIGFSQTYTSILVYLLYICVY